MSLKCTMILGNCLEVMPTLPGRFANLCFADLPYGRFTANKWDRCIDLFAFWKQIRSVSLITSVFVFTANQPFASTLIQSQHRIFRYELIWAKTASSGFLNANCRPLSAHENILVFSEMTANPASSQRMIFNPQKTTGKPYCMKAGFNGTTNFNHARGVYKVPLNNHSGDRYPTSVLRLNRDSRRTNLHPTQKPIALLDWLIRTYSNVGDNIVDPCSGSGTTAVSALQNGRHVTCIEKDANYFAASVERVKQHINDNAIDASLEIRC